MRRIWTGRKFWAVALALAITLVAAATAQEGKRRNSRPLRNQGGAPLPKVQPQGGDPLIRQNEPKAGPGTYHYTLRLKSFDGTPLAASYYPSKIGANAPVVVLIHEKGRSRKDFEDAVVSLKGKGLAEHLQDDSYAVFSIDLRGQGQNPRRPLNIDDREAQADDLQAVYQFLLDRHNRGELNVGRLGVVGVGEGANLAAAWAYQPGAAVSTEGRAGDLSALVMVSPQPEGSGYVLSRVAPPLALRVPTMFMAGGKDVPSKDAIDPLRQDVERSRSNKVEFYPSSLHGYKLLRLEPGAAEGLVKFLDANLKLRANEWEPRYNQIPVAYSDVQTVRRQTPEDKAKAEEKKAEPEAKKDEPEPKKADEKKADEKKADEKKAEPEVKKAP